MTCFSLISNWHLLEYKSQRSQILLFKNGVTDSDTGHLSHQGHPPHAKSNRRRLRDGNPQRHQVSHQPRHQHPGMLLPPDAGHVAAYTGGWTPPEQRRRHIYTSRETKLRNVARRLLSHISSDWRDFVRIYSMVTRMSASFSCRLESVPAWTIKHSECDIDCSDTSVFIQRLCPNVVYVLNVQCYDYYILVYL